ncbi:MAG: N-acetyltransferase [Pirellulales bacterium]
MLIRAEAPGDVTAIHKVIVSAFPTDAEARLVDLLRDSGRLTVSLAAVLQNHIIGHVAFSPVSVSLSTAVLGLGLAPLAVAESQRRRGVGAALVHEGLAACRAAGAGYAVVLGEPEYYGRFGFRAASEFGLCDEYGGGPAFQVLELREGGLPRNAGLVRYAPEFGIFGESV